MGLRTHLRDALRLEVERHLAARDPVAPGDVDALAARVSVYEARVPETTALKTALDALVTRMGPVTKDIVAGRRAAAEALAAAREAHARAEAILARAEALAEETP